MVRRVEKPSFLAASCCRVLVVNGACSGRLRCRFSTLVTTNGSLASSPTIRSASSRVWICGLWPSIFLSSASNSWPSLAQRASMLQYSWAVNARISRSRSTISLSATVCTRPAESPVLMLRHRIGLAL